VETIARIIRQAKTIAITGTLIFLSPRLVIAADQEEITVKSSSVNKNVVSVNAEIKGKLVQLQCFLSATECAVTKEGIYVMSRVISGKATYMDCPNVDLYEKDTRHRQGRKIGEYCFLGE
jgi:hypothetical protein